MGGGMLTQDALSSLDSSLASMITSSPGASVGPSTRISTLRVNALPIPMCRTPNFLMTR